MLGIVALVAVGLLLVTVGMADVCPLGVPFGGPFRGRDARSTRP